MGCGGCRQDLNAQQTFSLRIRERPAQAVLGRTPGKSPLEPGQIPMKLTSMAEAATPPLTKPRAADAAYDAIEVLFSTLQLAPCSPGVQQIRTIDFSGPAGDFFQPFLACLRLVLQPFETPVWLDDTMKRSRRNGYWVLQHPWHWHLCTILFIPRSVAVHTQ